MIYQLLSPPVINNNPLNNTTGISENEMNKIQCVSKFFRILFQIAFIALPLLQIAFWLNAPNPLKFLGDSIHFDMIPQITVLHPLSDTAKFLGFCINMIPTAISLYILYSLIKLFRLYEMGEIFSIKIVNHFRNVGYALLIGQLVPLCQEK